MESIANHWAQIALLIRLCTAHIHQDTHCVGAEGVARPLRLISHQTTNLHIDGVFYWGIELRRAFSIQGEHVDWHN